MLSNTFSDILSWMNSNKLLLNPSKTEFLLIGTKQQRLKFSQLTTLSLGNDIIPVSSSARNLGFIFDSDMSFTDQINSLSKSCHFHIGDIRRIRHLLPLSAATALANSLVSSKLDYCNSSRVINLDSVTILWLARFDEWFDFFGPFIKNLASMSLPKILAIFSRGQNQRWPPTPFWKIKFWTRAPITLYFIQNSKMAATR